MSVRGGLWALLPLVGITLVHAVGCLKGDPGGDGSSSSTAAATGGGTAAGAGGTGGATHATGAGGADATSTSGSGDTAGSSGSGDTDVAASSGVGGNNAVTTSSTSGGASGSGSACAGEDADEENDSAATATVLALRGSTTPGELYLTASRQQFLCRGDEDWFSVRTSYGDSIVRPSAILFSLRLQAAGAGLCGGACGDFVPEAAPENTVTVEVYNAKTMELVASDTDSQGRVWIDAFGPEFAQDVLIRVRGPQEAEYPYRLYVMVRSGYYEDECECLIGSPPDR